MADPQKLRSLKIKSGVVKRYTKEKQTYEKEADDQRIKIERFVQEGKDDLFLRQQRGCLQESVMMVPEIQRKLLTAYEELRDLTIGEVDNLGESEEYKTAVKILEEATVHLPSSTAN